MITEMANRQPRALKGNGLEGDRSVTKSHGDVGPEAIEAMVRNVMIDPFKGVGTNRRAIVYCVVVSILRKQRPECNYDRSM